MKRLHLVQVFIIYTLSFSLQASDFRSELFEVTDKLEARNCQLKMSKISSLLLELEAGDYLKVINEAGHDPLLDTFFDVKITLHEKLRDFFINNNFSLGCSVASREALRSLRGAEDLVSEDYYNKHGRVIKFPSSAFSSGNLHVKRHPDFEDFDLAHDLKSGDVILSRGNAYTSAAISSLGEFDTQFSHLSMIYRDESNKLWTVEAHIEVGSIVRPLSEHIADNNFRTAIFRFEDPEVAAKAAQYIFERVKKASQQEGNILYDFAFDQEESEKLFCSEVISHSIEHVTNKRYSIPLYPSQLMKRKAEFVKKLGIEAQASFIPSDIEVDPRFKLVAEWRDAARVTDNLQKDAVLQSMFSWSDKYGYQMKQGSSKTSFIYRNVAWPLRRAPYLKKYFKDKMPLNMSRDLIGYFGVLESVGKLLQENLKRYDQEALSSRGMSLLEKEKKDVLEIIRLDDLKSKRKKMHKMFRSSVKN
jgi:hypothetical protein